MPRKDFHLAVVSDRLNLVPAQSYFTMLQETPYSACTCNHVIFNPARPESAAHELERQHVALVQIGIPGRADYQSTLHGLLNIYAMIKTHPPAVGIITHDADHTHYVINQWSGTKHLPNGAVNVIDARRPLLPKTLQMALDILGVKQDSLAATPRALSPLSKLVTVDNIEPVTYAKVLG